MNRRVRMIDILWAGVLVAGVSLGCEREPVATPPPPELDTPRPDAEGETGASRPADSSTPVAEAPSRPSDREAAPSSEDGDEVPGGHSLRPGIWTLSMTVREVATSTPVPIPDRTVRLAIEPGAGGDSSEVVELAPVGAGSPSTSLYGDVDASGRIEIQSQDASWIFRLRGEIQDAKTVDGTRIGAYSRLDETTTLQGTWRLEWQSDDAANTDE